MHPNVVNIICADRKHSVNIQFWISPELAESSPAYSQEIFMTDSFYIYVL